MDTSTAVRFGAVLRKRKSYGAVRCGCKKKEILRCGPVRFSKIVVKATVRCGAVFKNRCERLRTVRFDAFIYPTVRFGTAFRNRESYRAVRGACVRCRKSYGAIRCGFPLNGFMLRCGSNHTRRENRTKPFFLYGVPYEKTVSKPRFHTVLKLL